MLFHTDAVQAAGHIPIDFHDLGADMLSVSGHKFHAPKGAGALLIRSGLILPNLMHGGSQQRGRRAGTENVPAIAALGEALTEAVSDMSEVNERLFRLTEELAERLLRTEGGRDMCVKRFGVHVGFDRSLARPAGDGCAVSESKGKSEVIFQPLQHTRGV